MIDTKVNAPIGTIVLDRRDARNAVSMAMADELRQAIGDMHQEQRVRAVVLTGAGDTFCMGRDLDEIAADALEAIAEERSEIEIPSPQEWGEQELDFGDLLKELLTFPKPVIAALNGPVAGFGVALAFACDCVIATDAAQLSLPSPRHGLIDGFAVPIVAHRFSAGLAARLAVLGETFDAPSALQQGLYRELVEHDLLWARAAELVAAGCEASPQAIDLTKRLLIETVGEKLLTDLSVAAAANATVRTTAAAREGLKAVADGRLVDWH